MARLLHIPFAKVLIILITFVSVMKFTLLTVGKTTFPFVEEGLGLYEKRLGFYINYKRIEIPELKNARALSFEQIRQKEGTLIFKNIKPEDTVLLMDERGVQYDSLRWAEKMEGYMQAGRDVVFIIGGAYGFSKEVYNRANGMISLSKMTFSHQIVRVIFIEQLYRACTIIKGEPYHHK